MKLNIETHTTPSGWVLKHTNGWMRETWVAQAVGFTQPHQARALPIKRLVGVGTTQRSSRYRLEDVQAFIEANTAAVGQATP
jgi:hypothetical protein